MGASSPTHAGSAQPGTPLRVVSGQLGVKRRAVAARGVRAAQRLLGRGRCVGCYMDIGEIVLEKGFWQVMPASAGPAGGQEGRVRRSGPPRSLARRTSGRQPDRSTMLGHVGV